MYVFVSMCVCIHIYYKPYNTSNIADYLGFCRETNPPDTERFISRNWLLQLWTSSKSGRRGPQPGDTKKSCSLCPKAICWQHSFLLGGSKKHLHRDTQHNLDQLDTVSQPCWCVKLTITCILVGKDHVQDAFCRMEWCNHLIYLFSTLVPA